MKYRLEQGVIHMVVYPIQHGETKSSEEDPERGLTERGLSYADGLSPNDSPRIWFERLSSYENDIIGYLPHLRRLSSLLLCGEEEKEFIGFTTGGALYLKRLTTYGRLCG